MDPHTQPAERIPVATYRLQFHQGFRFVDGRDLIPYLNDLGITDMYSSPRYKAKRGSSHGYDIADPVRINPELGTEDDFDEMSGKLRHYGMGLLLDTVPNHMAASYENPWWKDVLENGQASAFAGYFDINWHPATTKAAFLQENRILLPILGELYGDVLASGQLALKIEDTGIHVRYYDRRLPLDPKTYLLILKRCPPLPELTAVQYDLERLPGRDDPERERILERRREKERIKEAFWTAYRSSPDVRQAVDDALQFVSGSVTDLDEVLSNQAYRLAYWKIGYEEINYRRFFDINELVGLRIESTEVFDNRMRKTLALARSGQVTGLRIDHIDGLWDPGCYLQRLQAAAGNRLFVVVEKILGRGEEVPRDWHISGTTGYEFLNALNGIFIHPAGLARLEEIYGRVTGNQLPFSEICYACNKLVIQTLFTGDVNALGHHLGSLAARHRHARDVRLSELMQALLEVSACLPVYRTYIHNFEVSARDRAYIEQTVALARRRTSPEEISDPAFAFLRSVLLLEPPDYLESHKRDWLDFVMRWQQFTGPVMAKGLEDTATYRHNSLLSLNEVGNDPLRQEPPFDLDQFHQFNLQRLEEWPHSLNATATHDTKRGEDLRARLNVLSEIPDEWERHLDRWLQSNASRKAAVNGVLAPGASEEILIYQTLLGGWPVRPDAVPSFVARVKEFLVKALREAKRNSSWMAPNEPYEQAVVEFVDRIVAADSDFLDDFLEFQKIIARCGARNSLAQLVLKIAAPGIPDFYQGTECWQLSLVDPDNRRPVDYEKRIALLETIKRRESEDRIALLRDLASDPRQPELKMFVTYKGLQFRKSNPHLFARGDYLPLRAQGPHAANVCAFARRLEEKWVIALAARWYTQWEEWSDTELLLPDGAPAQWEDALTGLIPHSLRLSGLLGEFPVALLHS